MAPSRPGLIFSAAAVLSLTGCKQAMDLIGGKSGDTPASAATAAATVAPSQAAAAPSAAPAAPVAANAIDFGDDTSRWARDGECDDKRFAGSGMTDTPLLDEDIRHDATDCRSAFQQGRLTYQYPNGSAPSPQQTYAASGTDHIIWGDDASKFARDGECDDMRFTGPGMTDTPLLNSDVKHDATDCRTAYDQGRLTLK